MTRLDSRTWCFWGIATMVPMLVARHPIVVLELLGIVLLVRWLCMPRVDMRWSWIVRIAIIFAVIGVLFNALTVRSGDQVAFQLGSWDITWNAIAYGFVSGIAMVTLVLTGITVAAALDWIALMRVLPRRIAPLAASGSVAWSFLPGASQAITDIREAQAARGHQLRGGRDLLPIVVPLLDTSLSRALTMSEALEVRGFGAATPTTSERTSRIGFWSALCLGGGLMLAYAISLADMRYVWPSAAAFLVGLTGLVRSPTQANITTRYREQHLSRQDWIITLASILSLSIFLVVFITNPGGVAFSPYPNLELVAPDYRAILALALLLVPAAFPAGEA
ncbi:MAG: energy-coupling factor transporter transmembrane protein EcfT [Thermomicrobiales bacterium]|nr:energy-coupling factor transporter transmembrane protein EcfT [Thermomicrobiales bacterium]